MQQINKILTILDAKELPDAKKYGFTEPVSAVLYGEGKYFIIRTSDFEKLVNSLEDYQEAPAKNLDDAVADLFSTPKQTALDFGVKINNEVTKRDGNDPSDDDLLAVSLAANKGDQAAIKKLCSYPEHVLMRKPCVSTVDKNVKNIVAQKRSESLSLNGPSDVGIPGSLAAWVNGGRTHQTSIEEQYVGESPQPQAVITDDADKILEQQAALLETIPNIHSIVERLKQRNN